MMNSILCGVTRYTPPKANWRFGVIGGPFFMYIRNVDWLPTDYMTLHPRKHNCSALRLHPGVGEQTCEFKHCEVSSFDNKHVLRRFRRKTGSFIWRSKPRATNDRHTNIRAYDRCCRVNLSVIRSINANSYVEPIIVLGKCSRAAVRKVMCVLKDAKKDHLSLCEHGFLRLGQLWIFSILCWILGSHGGDYDDFYLTSGI
jgi:hypothetical protein